MPGPKAPSVRTLREVARFFNRLRMLLREPSITTQSRCWSNRCTDRMNPDLVLVVGYHAKPLWLSAVVSVVAICAIELLARECGDNNYRPMYQPTQLA
jgi:hypothetical protein